MYKYKNKPEMGFFAKIGDKVSVSKKYAKEFGSDTGIVVNLDGFIVVQFPNGDKVDFDARSVSFVSRD